MKSRGFAGLSRAGGNTPSASLWLRWLFFLLRSACHPAPARNRGCDVARAPQPPRRKSAPPRCARSPQFSALRPPVFAPVPAAGRAAPSLLCPVEWHGPFGWSNQPRLRHWRRDCPNRSVSRKRQKMAREKKIEGKAIARILDARTRETVGYLFEWNTGDVDPKWNDDIPREEKDIIYEYA